MTTTLRFLSMCFFIGILGTACTKEAPDPEDEEMEMETEPHLPPQFEALTSVFGDRGVGAAVWLGEDVTLLFDITGLEYVWIENGEIKDRRSTDDELSLVKDAPFSTVGAATALRSRIYYFGNGGQSYSNMSYDAGNVKGRWADTSLFTMSNASYLLHQWGVDGSCPIDGVRAAMSWHMDRKCDDDIDFAQWVTMFDLNSSRHTFYDGEDVQFYAELPVENYSLYQCGTPEKQGLDLNTVVDAACVYVVDGVAYELFFYNSGERFVYSEIGSMETSEHLKIKSE